MYIQFISSIVYMLVLALYLCVIYVICSHLKSFALKNPIIIFIAVIILPAFTLFLILVSMTHVFTGFYIFCNKNQQAASTLTTGVIATLSLLSVLFANLYKNHQSRIQSIHNESSWRKIALEFEQEKTYTIGSLIKLNSLFNAYKNQVDDDFPPIDFSINRVIVTILDKHRIKRKELNEFKKLGNIVYNNIPLKYRKKYKENSDLIPYMYKELLKDEFNNIHETKLKLRKPIIDFLKCLKSLTALLVIPAKWLIMAVKWVMKNAKWVIYEQPKNTPKGTPKRTAYIELKNGLTLFNYDINNWNVNIPLNSEENQMVRICIHALLKADWDNVTK